MTRLQRSDRPACHVPLGQHRRQQRPLYSNPVVDELLSRGSVTIDKGKKSSGKKLSGWLWKMW